MMPALRHQLPDVRQSPTAVEHRHRQVEEHDVGPRAADDVDALAAVARLGHDIHAALGEGDARSNRMSSVSSMMTTRVGCSVQPPAPIVAPFPSDILGEY